MALAIVLVLAAAAAAAFVVADDDSVDPDRYAEDVCRSTRSWFEGLTADSRRLDAGLSEATTVREAKDLLEGFLESAADRTGALGDDIVAAGVPDGDSGAEFADQFEGAVRQVEDAFAHSRDDVSQVPDDDGEALAAAADRAVRDLDALSSMGSAVSDFSDSDVGRALSRNDDCQEFVDAVDGFDEEMGEMLEAV